MFKRIHFINATHLSYWGPWIFGFLAHVVAGIYSTGHHHLDELFQTWEWAHYFLGLSPDNQALPWEFGQQIRPWFQPFIQAAWIQIHSCIGIQDPFLIATTFRVFLGAIATIAMFQLFHEFKKRFPADYSRTWVPWVLVTLWFLPYLHVRSSSENISGILLVFAFVFFFRNRIFWMGSLLGFAFLARYQIALGLIGLGFFWLWQDRGLGRRSWVLMSGFALSVFIGVLLDRFGYGNWVFAPYRYFSTNLIAGVAATYNPYPWYQYLLWVLELNPFVSVPLIYGFFRGVKRQGIDSISAFIFSFFLLHCLISNKEYRFLFPILTLIPFYAILGWTHFFPKLWAIVNIPLLAWICLRIAAPNYWVVFQFPELSRTGFPVISNGGYTTSYFYRIEDFEPAIFSDEASLKIQMDQIHDPEYWLVWSESVGSEQFYSIKSIIEERCRLEKSELPSFIFHWKETIPAIRRLRYQAVYRCSNSSKL